MIIVIIFFYVSFLLCIVKISDLFFFFCFLLDVHGSTEKNETPHKKHENPQALLQPASRLRLPLMATLQVLCAGCGVLLACPPDAKLITCGGCGQLQSTPHGDGEKVSLAVRITCTTYLPPLFPFELARFVVCTVVPNLSRDDAGVRPSSLLETSTQNDFFFVHVCINNQSHCLACPLTSLSPPPAANGWSSLT